MSIENELQEYILARYGSVTEFCLKYGIASSTIFTAFKRGFENTSTKTMMKICDSLKISPDKLADGVIAPLTDVDSVKIDLAKYISELSNADLSFKGKKLNEDQKEKFIFASKLAINTILHDK